LAVRDFDAGFKAAESLCVQPLRLQSSGSVFAGDVVGTFVIFFARSDNEIAILNVSIFRTVCVGFEFVVPPTAAAEIVGPFFWIGSGAVGTVEFVGPNERKIFWRGLRGW